MKMQRIFTLLISFMLWQSAFAATKVDAPPVPAEMRSTSFTVTVNGHPVDVAHAATNYDFVSFDANGPVEVSITASDPNFWSKGVDVEPWRLGMRPERNGATIRFKLDGPVKLSIGQPGEFLNQAKMLFLFYGRLTHAPQESGVRIIPAGVHHESLNPKSGDTIYFEPGAYLFGSLNLWQVHDVKVMGRGVIVYEGQQDPSSDEGWMRKPDWRCITSYQSRNVEVDGLTCVIRSRTWSIQMTESDNFTYNDLRVIGGNPANANQDGMDFLGTGNSVVRDSFLRASDDVIAVLGNWDGYDEASMRRFGHDVNNIIIEDSQLSTSISNIVRAGWPKKSYKLHNLTVRNSDILHGGIGACGQDFAVLGFWGAQGSYGEHTGLHFQNLFLDNWYSLAQIEQEKPYLSDIEFRNIWMLGQPQLVPSTLKGDVSGVKFANIKLGQKRLTSESELPVVVGDGAAHPEFVPATEPEASFTIDTPFIEPFKDLHFVAALAKDAQYHWYFGDGTEAEGRKVHHRFPDAEGTERDGKNGAGRFRVLLHVTSGAHQEDWAVKSVVVVKDWHPAATNPLQLDGGLLWKLYPQSWSSLPNLDDARAQYEGPSAGLTVNAQGFTRYAVRWEGYLEVPADGGYNFALMARDGARLFIDNMPVAETGVPFAQVCGAVGNAVRFNQSALGLRAGPHRLRIEWLRAESDSLPRLLWEGPGIPLSDVPQAAYKHQHVDGLSR